MRGCASSPSVSSPAGCACDSYPCTSAQPDPSAQGEIGGASICEHYRASPAIPGGPARVLQAPEFVWSSGSGSFPGARAARHLAVFRWRKRPPAPPAGPATAAFAWFALTSHQKRSQKRSASRRRCRERKQWKILFCNWPQVVSVVGFVVLNVHRFAPRSSCRPASDHCQSGAAAPSSTYDLCGCPLAQRALLPRQTPLGANTVCRSRQRNT